MAFRAFYYVPVINIISTEHWKQQTLKENIPAFLNIPKTRYKWIHKKQEDIEFLIIKFDCQAVSRAIAVNWVHGRVAKSLKFFLENLTNFTYIFIFIFGCLFLCFFCFDLSVLVLLPSTYFGWLLLPDFFLQAIKII